MTFVIVAYFAIAACITQALFNWHLHARIRRAERFVASQVEHNRLDDRWKRYAHELLRRLVKPSDSKNGT